MSSKENAYQEVSSNFGSLDVFDHIYKSGLWGKGSGGGSDPHECQLYINWLQSYIQENNIKSIVDLGCGDWQYMQILDLNNINYLGIDAAATVIDSNSINFSSQNISFKIFTSYSDIPDADMLICKDVMQHLSNEEVFNILEILPRFNQSVITNDIAYGFSAKHQLLQRLRKPWTSLLNRNIKTGDYRPIDISKPPFNVNGLFAFQWKVNPYTLKRRLNPKNLIFGFDCESIKKTYVVSAKSITI